MDPLLRLARRISRLGTWFGGTLLVAAAVLIGIEVVIRKAFSLTIGGADELSGFALAISTAWALGFTLFERAHVRIDSLYVHLPVRLCAVLDILGLALFLGFFTLITAYGAVVLETSWRLGARSLSPLGTPLVIPQLLWLLGLITFLLSALLLLVRAVIALASGDLAGVRRLAGSRTVGEEIASELAGSEVAPGRASAGGNR